MQQASLFRFFQVDPFPVGNGRLCGPITAAAPCKPILQDSGLVLEQALILGAFCADVEADLRFVECPIHP